MNSVTVGPDDKLRCSWCSQTDNFIPYHDYEWGMPVKDDQHLFEKICLESFQSGLSWRTIFDKRDHFRRAFAKFDFNKIALFDSYDVESLLNNSGIVRHRGKIEAVLNNAKRAQELIEEFGSLAHFFWRFECDKERHTKGKTSISPESNILAKELKKRGWKFVGPTTVYAFMQAAGLVNDHAIDCVIKPIADEAKKNFKRP